MSSVSLEVVEYIQDKDGQIYNKGIKGSGINTGRLLWGEKLALILMNAEADTEGLMHSSSS